MLYHATRVYVFLGLLFMTLMNFASNNQSLFSLGLREYVYVDESRVFDNQSRKLEVTVWYPTSDITSAEVINNDIWKVKNVVRNASFPANTNLPLIMFSHGFSGNQWQNCWFAEFFAARGFIVAAVRHYGNSMPLMIPEICIRSWNRPQDMSFALDHILAQPDLKNYIDQDNIFAAGFSQGGATCMWLAGVQAELTPENIKEQFTMMNAPDLRSKFFSNVSNEKMDSLLDEFTAQDFQEANRSYYDSRFKAVFGIAPAIDDQNVMFTKQGLAKATTPAYLIVGESDEGTTEQIPFFAAHIPQCIGIIIPGHVTHWTMLNEGTEKGKKERPYITIDHESVDRSKIHEETALRALDFFSMHLNNNL